MATTKKATTKKATTKKTETKAKKAPAKKKATEEKAESKTPTIEASNGKQFKLTEPRLEALNAIKQLGGTKAANAVPREKVWEKLGGKDASIKNTIALRKAGLIAWADLEEGRAFYLTQKGQSAVK